MNVLKTILISSLLTAVAVAAPPQWYTTGNNHRYPSDFYFTGIGSGQTYEAALEAAQGQIARQIQVKVESEVTNLVSGYQKDDQESISSEFKILGRSIADASLQGIEIGSRDVDGVKHYVFIALEKSKYAQGLKTELDNLSGSIGQRYGDSDKLLGSGKILPALEILLETQGLAEQFFTKSALYGAISGNAYPTEGITQGPAILSHIRETLNRVTLTRIAGDNQTGRVGILLPQPLVVRATFKSDAAPETPLSQFPLVLKEEPDKVLAKGVTDADGKAEFWAEVSHPARGRMAVTVDLAQVSSVLRRDLKRQEALFRYEGLSAGPFAFKIEISGQDGKRVPEAEDRVAASVLELGHRVSEDAPLLLTGKFQLSESHQVEGVGGSQYVAKTELPLFLQDRVSGEKLAEVPLHSQGMDKASAEQAVARSYRNLRISFSDMARMISEGGDKLRAIGDSQSGKALNEARTLSGQGKYQEALQTLGRVIEGEKNLAERDSLLRSIHEKQISDAK